MVEINQMYRSLQGSCRKGGCAQNLCLKVLGTAHVTAISGSSAALELGPYGKQLSVLFSQLLLRKECLLPALPLPAQQPSCWRILLKLHQPDSQTHVALM